MSLYNYHYYTAAGIAVPSESPFFPHIDGDNVAFNQGFVFDYQKLTSGAMTTLPVTMADSYDLNISANFFLQITTPTSKARVYDASVIQGALPNTAENFHYSAGNLGTAAEPSIGDDPYRYSEHEGVFIIPMCDFEKDAITSRWRIKNIYIRENIHWQKINFANTLPEEDVAESIGVLKNWGESNQFLNNPNVEFKRIVQKASGLDPIIKIENSPNGENIVVTTQLPPLPSGYNVILQRYNDEWQWVQIPPDCYVISSPFSEVFFVPMDAKSTPYVDSYGGFSQLPFPTEAAVIADGPHVLHSDGNTIYWAPIDVYY